MNTNLISVIIPVYNREKYISRCLDSVLNQTYKNLEIVLVDDGSIDNSKTIIEKYRQDDKRIKLIALNQNGGVSNARNIGIENSTGKYISFIDSDDYIEKDMYKTLIEVLENGDFDLVTSDINLVGSEKQMSVPLTPYLKYDKNVIIEEILPRFTYEGADNLAVFAFTTKLYKKEIIKNAGIKFDRDIQYEEDKLFVIEYLANCNSLCYVPEKFYNYEIGNGLYSSFNKNGYIWYIKAFEKYLFYINEYGIKNINYDYLNDAFIYNITWFLYRSDRIKKRKERITLQKNVIKNAVLQETIRKVSRTLKSDEKIMASALKTKNRFLAIKAIRFIYSGKKKRLTLFLKRK